MFCQLDQNTDLAALLIGDKLDSAPGFVVLRVKASAHCTCPPCRDNVRPVPFAGDAGRLARPGDQTSFRRLSGGSGEGWRPEGVMGAATRLLLAGSYK